MKKSCELGDGKERQGWGRERESQRLCSSEIRSYGLVVSLVCLWIQSKCVCLEAFPFSFSPLGTSLKAPQQWAEQSFHIQKRSLFPLACFFTPIRFHFLCFLLLYGPHVRLRASNGQMGWPPTHEHPLCSILTTIISSPLCISVCVCVCVCVGHGTLLLLLLRHSTAIHELSKRLSNLSAPIIPSPKQKASSSERKQSLDQRAHPLLQNTVKLIMQSDCQSCWPLLAF